MIRRGLRHFLVTAVLSAVVLLWGWWIVGPEGRSGVAIGVGLAFAFQLTAFWLLIGVAFPNKPLLAYGLGMIGRLALVVLTALVVIPVAGVPGAPTLFALVSVLFATTVLDPSLQLADSGNKL